MTILFFFKLCSEITQKQCYGFVLSSMHLLDTYIFLCCFSYVLVGFFFLQVGKHFPKVQYLQNKKIIINAISTRDNISRGVPTYKHHIQATWEHWLNLDLEPNFIVLVPPCPPGSFLMQLQQITAVNALSISYWRMDNDCMAE